MTTIASESPFTAEAVLAGNMRNLKGLIANSVHSIANSNTVGFQQIVPVVNGKSTNVGVDRDLTFPMDVRNYRDLTPGAPQPTDNPFDVALIGGYLGVETPDGQAYTQMGQLSIDPETGSLTTLHGNYPVLDEGGGQIPVEGSIHIALDGSITDDSGEFIARLGVFGFNEDPDGSLEQAMVKIGGNLYTSEQELEPLDRPQVMQYYLQGSNVEVPTALVDLHQLVDAYQQGTSLSQQSFTTQKQVIDNLIYV